MKWKTIETSREIRQWIGIITSWIGIGMAIWSNDSIRTWIKLHTKKAVRVVKTKINNVKVSLKSKMKRSKARG